MNICNRSINFKIAADLHFVFAQIGISLPTINIPFEIWMSPNQKQKYKKKNAYSASFLWNNLPISVCECNNTNVFKTNIKNYIFDSSYHQGSVSFIILFISNFLFYFYDIWSIFLVCYCAKTLLMNLFCVVFDLYDCNVM